MWPEGGLSAALKFFFRTPDFKLDGNCWGQRLRRLSVIMALYWGKNLEVRVGLGGGGGVGSFGSPASKGTRWMTAEALFCLCTQEDHMVSLLYYT